MLESCEEHTHEAHGGEVADGSDAFFILSERNAELIPMYGFRLLIAQRSCVGTHVHDVVLANLEVLRTDGDAILEILLIFVERVVLIDILHVRCRLV